MSGGRFALIVTSDTYLDPRLSSLRAPTADAEQLGQVLSDPGIGEFEVAVSHNEPEHVVRRRLSAFFENRGLDDLLVLHMSCHGVKDEDGRLYFATEDTEVDHLDATAIPADFVNRQMTRCRSRRIVLLLDCCYSGAFARGLVGRGGDRVDLKERFEGRGRIVLTASSAMEYSFEGDQTTGQGRPSVFTSAIVEGLATGAADRDKDGFVTVDELYDFAFEQVRTVTPSQTPGKWVFDVQGDVHLARSAAGVPATEPSLPAELDAAMVSPFARVRRGAVEELGTLIGNPDKKLAAAAFEALVKLTQDDSKEVSRAARRYVATNEEGVPGTPIRPQQTRLPPPETDPPTPGLQLDDPAPERSVADPAVPSWVSWVCRGAAFALVAAPTVPLVTEKLSTYVVFMTLGPVQSFLGALLVLLVSEGCRSRRVRVPVAAGALIGLGAALTAGSLGLLSFGEDWSDTAGLVGGVLGLLGAAAAGFAGVFLLRVRSAAPARESVPRLQLALGSLGVALTVAVPFLPYDDSRSLWTELVDSSLTAAAYLPLASMLVMAAGLLLLWLRPMLGAGLLTAAGVLTATHLVVLLGVTVANDESRPGLIAGVAGGVLAAVAGWRAEARRGHGLHPPGQEVAMGRTKS